VVVTEQTHGKGRPTPKRRDAEKRRGGPVAPPPTTRKEAAQQQRAKQAAAKQRPRAAADDRVLLPRDQGPVRRFVRDFIDARRNLGALLMPMAAVSLLSFFTKDPRIQAAVTGVWLATLMGVAMDMALLSGVLRRQLRERFPGEAKLGSHIRYGLLRTTVIRKLRMPRPAVQRGQKV